ncbi:unnamed protein product [Mucor circinelloides]
MLITGTTDFPFISIRSKINMQVKVFAYLLLVAIFFVAAQGAPSTTGAESPEPGSELTSASPATIPQVPKNARESPRKGNKKGNKKGLLGLGILGLRKK